MQRFADNLPRVAHSGGGSERVSISFRTQPGLTLLWGDAEMLPTNIVRHGEGGSPFQRSSGSAAWGGLSLPVEDAAVVGETLADGDLTRPKQTLIVTPAPSAMARLQQLHSKAAGLAEDAPEIIAHPEAARSLEQALIQAMADCLATREGRKNTLAQGQHAIVMRRFRRVVEENPDQPLFIPEICKAIRVPGRTLRMCCQEHLGMGPKRYLLLRRLHMARRALREATPDAMTVTDVATRYGFWQLGRFAVEYRSLFGELPSDTLSRQPK
jgi:AraC-like DNA-binding protein